MRLIEQKNMADSHQNMFDDGRSFKLTGDNSSTLSPILHLLGRSKMRQESFLQKQFELNP